MHRLSPSARFAVFALFASLAQSAFATDGDPLSSTMQLDSKRSQVDFRVRVMWLLHIGGRFSDVHGQVHVDSFRNQVRVEARIDVATVSMGSHGQEDWVKSPEFFDAARYPQIEFSSDPIPLARLRNGGTLPGNLTVRGIRQPVVFDLQAAECNRPAFDCPIEVAGTLRRSAFDMRTRRGTLSDKVELEFTVYAQASGPS